MPLSRTSVPRKHAVGRKPSRPNFLEGDGPPLPQPASNLQPVYSPLRGRSAVSPTAVLDRSGSRGLGWPMLSARPARPPCPTASPCGSATWLYRPRLAARPSAAAVPVVSVGNLTVGGTGKTPCVEYVARFYRGRDLRVAILSRGYGADGGPQRRGAGAGREPARRAAPARAPTASPWRATAVEELESEVLVLDDGFQHRRLARDLDLVLIDATGPWGHGHLLPRGLLREPPAGLRRAGVVAADALRPGRRRRAAQRLRETVAPARPGRAGGRDDAPAGGAGQRRRRDGAAGRAARPAGGGVLRHRQPGGVSPHARRDLGADGRRLPRPSPTTTPTRATDVERPARLGAAAAATDCVSSRRRRTWSSCA